MRTARIAVACALLAACGQDGKGAVADAPEPVALGTEVLARLDDGTRPVLARPLSVARTGSGDYLVPDRSDHDLKLYGADGKRGGTLGRAGRGPGEFSALTSGGVFRDTVYGFDMVAGRLYLFDDSGSVARALAVPNGTWSVNAVDDSLFLVVRSIAPVQRAALALMRPDGTLRSSFFDASRFVGRSPELTQLSAVVADARDGTVFAGVFGGDSLYAFDYAGRRKGAAPVDRTDPLPSFRALARTNGGRLRRPDGGWLVDGAEVVIALVALTGGRAVLHVQSFDAETGLDRVEGGRLLLVEVVRSGEPMLVGQARIAAGLMGRDTDGDALLLGYAPDDPDEYVLQRLTWSPAAARN